MRNAILLIAVFFASVAHGDPDYLTGRAQDLPNFVVLLSPLCEKIYYSPKSFEVEPQLSSILMTKKTFPDGKSRPVINLNIAISPKPWNTNSREQQELLNFAKEACPNSTPTLAEYPAPFQSIDVNSWAAANLLSISSTPTISYRNVIQIEVDPSKTSLSELLTQLQYLSPAQTVRFFSQVEDVYVELSAAYHAASEFSEKWWNDRQCTIVNDCTRAAGIKIKCSDSEECVDIPRMAQVFKGAEYRSTFVFFRRAAINTPEEKIAKLENELMSRLMHSLYVESSRIQLGSLTQVTLGQLKKQSAGEFHDHVSAEHLDEGSYTSSIAIPKLDEFAKPILEQLYKEYSKNKRGSRR